jgi:serine/threonine protein kinase
LYPGIPNPTTKRIIPSLEPPENIDNRKYRKYTDVWTLGLTLVFFAKGVCVTSQEDWYGNKDQLLEDIFSSYTVEQRTSLKEFMGYMLEHNYNRRPSCEELLNAKLFNCMNRIIGRRIALPITYHNSNIDSYDKELFSMFWKFVNRNDISPRTVCNSLDIYHRHMDIVIKEGHTGEALIKHKYMSMSGSLIIAYNINDDIRHKPFKLLTWIFGNYPEIGDDVIMLEEYVLNMTVACKYNISNAPLYEYIVNNNNYDRYEEFCQLFPILHIPQEYIRAIHNSPREKCLNEPCNINMACILHNSKNAKYYDICCSNLAVECNGA